MQSAPCQDCRRRRARNQGGDAFNATASPVDDGVEEVRDCRSSFRPVKSYFSAALMECASCRTIWLLGYYEDMDVVPIEAEWGERTWIWRLLRPKHVAEIEAAAGTQSLDITTFADERGSLTVFRRHAYDDVALLASTDPQANEWRLEVESAKTELWQLVKAAIQDSAMNWSTEDLTLWDVLRVGEPQTVQRIFPESGSSVPARAPFAVTWDVSDWYPWPDALFIEERRFRFFDPSANMFEFRLRELLGQAEHVFG